MHPTILSYHLSPVVEEGFLWRNCSIFKLFNLGRSPIPSRVYLLSLLRNRCRAINLMSIKNPLGINLVSMILNKCNPWMHVISFKCPKMNSIRLLFYNQHRSKSSALSSAEKDQIFGGVDLFLSIALNYQLWCDYIFLFKVDI